MLLIIFGCLPEDKLGPQKRACAVTFVYVVTAETVYMSKDQGNFDFSVHDPFFFVKYVCICVYVCICMFFSDLFITLFVFQLKV